MAVFKEFTESGYEDAEYGKFLEWFVNGGNETEVNGKTWEVLGADRSTRDANTVHEKIDHLVALFGRYFSEVEKAAWRKIFGGGQVSPHTQRKVREIYVYDNKYHNGYKPWLSGS